jgi:hypothetical protein
VQWRGADIHHGEPSKLANNAMQQYEIFVIYAYPASLRSAGAV